MSKFEDWAKFNQMEKIRSFIKSLGYERISDSSSQNQIYEKNSNVIIIRKKIEDKLEKYGAINREPQECIK